MAEKGTVRAAEAAVARATERLNALSERFSPGAPAAVPPPPIAGVAERPPPAAASEERAGQTAERPSLASRLKADPAASGFTARFDDASLWDLIQFECLRRRSERTLRVSSQGLVGYIYFRGGNIVHASTLRAVGEAAIREMLSWTAGAVEPWNARWPDRETIAASWQSLLLGAAHAADRSGEAAVLLRPGLRERSGKRGEGAAAVPPSAPAAPAAPPPPPRVVLAPNGRVLEGGAVYGLPEAAAYAAQVADLIGEFMGFDPFRAIEAAFDRTHVLVARKEDGGVVAQRGREPELLEPLRRELSL